MGNLIREVRHSLKHFYYRQLGHLSAETKEFTIKLDTSRASNIREILDFKKRVNKGRWEKEFVQTCFDTIGKDETILEIGTWVGPFSVLFGKYLVPQGKVYSFEPDPVSFKNCLNNLVLNEVSNVFLFPVSISDKVTTVPLYTNGMFGNSGSSIFQTTSFSESDNQEMIEVPSTTIDKMVEALGIEPTTIKMDIEGAENLALKGGKKTIAKEGLKIFLEVHHEYLLKRGSNANEIFKQLADAGKSIYFLENNKEYPFKFNEKLDPTKEININNFHILAM
ncbi:MAG: FkbM family methyltransferase [Nitrospinae bacterium]|nr:FkbM family methyltransferase [Nitrospinota bacterium]